MIRVAHGEPACRAIESLLKNPAILFLLSVVASAGAAWADSSSAVGRTQLVLVAAYSVGAEPVLDAPASLQFDDYGTAWILVARQPNLVIRRHPDLRTPSS